MRSRRDEVVAPIHAVTVSTPVAVGTGRKDTKRCPWCNNLVDRLAKLCKGCGFRFTLPEALRRCPRCSEILFAFSVLCPSCRFDIESYFHQLRVKGHHFEEEAKEFVTEKVMPKMAKYEHELVELAHHARHHHDVDRKEKEKKALVLFSRTASPGGTNCFRCGSSIPIGVHRCPTCKIRVLLT